MPNPFGNAILKQNGRDVNDFFVECCGHTCVFAGCWGFGAAVAGFLWCGCPGAFFRSAARPERREAGPDDAREGLLAALLFRCAAALGSLVLYNVWSGAALGLAELPELWCRWDAPHYVKLAELGYGGYLEGGQPLYVWLMRILTVVFGHAALAGMTVSFLCFAWGCVYLYRLGCEEYGPRTARRALLLLACYPFSFFFGGIMTESLFFLTTAAGLYSIRRHAWGRAAIWGILAAMTRMQGVILIGAAVAELGSELRPLARTGLARRQAFGVLGRKLPLLCAPALGSLVYLALNFFVAGDAFAFTRMQEHWSQGFQWFSEVLVYLARNAMTWPKLSTRWEMWIPELVLFPVVALLLWKN